MTSIQISTEEEHTEEHESFCTEEDNPFYTEEGNLFYTEEDGERGGAEAKHTQAICARGQDLWKIFNRYKVIPSQGALIVKI